MLLKTYRARAALLYIAAFSLVLILFFFSFFFLYRSTLLRGVDLRLSSSAKALVLNEISPKLLDPDSEVIRRAGDGYFRLTNRNGEVSISSLGGSKDNQQMPLDRNMMLAAFAGKPHFETVMYKGERFRILYYPVNEENILHVGSPLEGPERAITLGRNIFLIFLIPLFSAVGLVCWILAGRTLQPLVALARSADEIRRGKLNERIVLPRSGREIDELVSIFNDMHDNVQRSIDTQKRFASDVSHEIRSPLTSLRGSIEVALRKKRSAQEYEELLRTNLSDIIRLSRMADSLLFLARADNNIVEMRRQWFDVGGLLERISDMLAPKAAAAGIAVRGEYAENLEINGDLELLEQAFTNLLDNAIKYSRPGGEVRIRAEKEGEAAVVTFRDNGIGIPGKDIPRIFDRFYRVRKPGAKISPGTGLGLAITHWIISAHQGKIDVESTEGAGTEFAIRLPAS